MGLFAFIKEAGEKLFGHKDDVSPEEQTRLNQAAAQAIFDHINSFGLKWSTDRAGRRTRTAQLEGTESADG